MSQDPTVGYVELWRDGVQQQFADGASRLFMRIYRANNTRGLYPVLTNYRRVDSYGGTVTIYLDAGKVARTYAVATG